VAGKILDFSIENAGGEKLVRNVAFIGRC